MGYDKLVEKYDFGQSDSNSMETNLVVNAYCI